MSARKVAIDQIRLFNRRYVPAMRLLDRAYLDTGMSALETAALIEIGGNEGCSARDISLLLAMDKGQLSRAIKRFEERGWVAKAPSPDDARLQLLSLTDAGRAYVDGLAEAGEGIVARAFDGANDDELAQVADTFSHVLAILENGAGTRTCGQGGDRAKAKGPMEGEPLGGEDEA